MKLTSFLVGLYLFLLTSTGWAENWVFTGGSDLLKTYTDTDAITQVALPDGKIVPYIYSFRERLEFTSDMVAQVHVLLDIQSGKVFLIDIDGSENIDPAILTILADRSNRWKPAEMRSSLGDLAFVYTHQKEITKRPPHILNDNEQNFGLREPSFLTNSPNWRWSYEFPDKNLAGKLFLPSIQIYQPDIQSAPAIRFLAIMTHPNPDLESQKSSPTVDHLVLCEVYPSAPQKHLLIPLAVKNSQTNYWDPIVFEIKPDYQPYVPDSPASFLGSTGYEYFLTNSSKVLQRGQFTPKKDEKSNVEWIHFIQ